MAHSYIQQSPTFNFISYEKTIDADLVLSNGILGNVTNTGKEVIFINCWILGVTLSLGTAEHYLDPYEYMSKVVCLDVS